MRTTKPITISLPTNILRETERIAKEEVRTRTDVIREALNQYVASRRWRRLRQWGAQTAERLDLKTEDDLENLLDHVRAQGRKTRA